MRRHHATHEGPPCTSIINFLFADDAPELRDVTIEFFESHLVRFDVAISDVVLFEIGKTVDEDKRNRLLAAVERYGLPIIRPAPAEERQVLALAGRYMDAGMIPHGKREDALHLATATVMRYDILLSWNFRHLTNIRTQMRVKEVNARCGYRHPLSLLDPMELMYES